MDRWAREFDNWAICDTLCFHLFDRTSHAWDQVDQWSRRREEFVKREAPDHRDFVRKAVNMALRAIGKRTPALKVAAVAVARRLSESSDSAARWVGKDALRELGGTPRNA